MNKRSLRAFSIGIFFSVGVFGAYYYGFGQKSEKITEKEAIQLLENKQYIVLTKEKYNQLKNEKNEPIKEEKITAKTPKVNKKKEEAAKAKQPESVYTYKLEIKRGMTSQQIAVILEKQGIIDNAENLSQYLSASGYSRKLQLGVFNLSSDMSFYQIANTITRKS